MKPSDTKERTRERKRKERMSRPICTTSGQRQCPLTPQVIIQDLSPPDNVTPVTPLVVTEDGGKLYAVTPLPQRKSGKTPEECGYPPGQGEVHTGPQGQKLWRLRGHYDLPTNILCFNCSRGTHTRQIRVIA